MSPAPTDDDVSAVLGELLGGEVADLRRLSGGASRQTWSFDLVANGGRRPLILQLERPGGVRTGAGMVLEAALLRAAAAAGAPVAAVVGSGADDGFGAPWLVVGRVAGETIPRKLLRDSQFAAARERLPAQCGRALAAIHSIPIEAVPGLGDPDQLAQFRSILSAMGEPRPALELGLRQLEATRPERQRRTIVHGDFRTGNLVVGPDGLRTVLDWELAHVGDPVEDLGWFCLRAWRFGSAAPAGGFGPVEDLVVAYEDASGVGVDPSVVRWWEAMGTLKWGVMCLIQAGTHLSGLSRSVELAAIGRRVCENEWDLLGLLGAPLPVESPPTVPAPSEPAPAPPFGRPTAVELVEAVREFVEEDVMSATEGPLRFHARVAANALAVVQREQAMGPGLTAAHVARVAALGFRDDADLAEAIRAGRCDDRGDEVAAAVALSVRDQLLVANPRHLEPDQ